MRYGAGHKAQTKSRILDAAAGLFRSRGYQATGVDAVMASADLTAGAFYAHFSSKEDLLAGALDNAFQQSRAGWPARIDRLSGAAWLRAFASFYLSREHRDHADRGCPMPALAQEVGRLGDESRQVFERHLRGLVDTVDKHIEQDSRDAGAAISKVALSVGALVLARAVSDPDFSDRILSACRDALVDAPAHS
jgi:TetR/AcrR family transcriptional repressor of nem operon